MWYGENKNQSYTTDIYIIKYLPASLTTCLQLTGWWDVRNLRTLDLLQV